MMVIVTKDTGNGSFMNLTEELERSCEHKIVLKWKSRLVGHGRK